MKLKKKKTPPIAERYNDLGLKTFGLMGKLEGVKIQELPLH